MKKVASICKIKNRYELTDWLFDLPWRLLPYEIDELIEKAKGNDYIMWSQKFGFEIW